MSTDPNDFLMGGGGTSAKFENVGDVVTGVISSTPEVKQQTDPQTGKPTFWDNGDPKMQLIVVLSTDQRDADNDEDDGTRRIYVKGKLQYAVRDAVKLAGAKGLEVGGRLTITHTGLGDAPFKGASRAKLYSAEYVSAGNVALNAPEPTASPAQAYAPPVQQAAPAPQAAAPAFTPEQLQAFANYQAQQAAQAAPAQQAG